MTKHLAIQLFGYMRTFEETYEKFFENVVSPQLKNGYMIDIFIHTWDTTNTAQPCGGASNPASIKSTESVKKSIIKYYSPRVLEIDNQFDVSDKQIQSIAAKVLNNADVFIPYNRLYNQYYTMYRVNEIRHEYERAKGIKYDMVFQTRPDILFLDKIDIDATIQLSRKENEHIHIADSEYSAFNMPLFTACSCTWPYCVFTEPSIMGATDVCFFSIPESIDIYTSIFTKLNQHIKHGFFNHEYFLMSYMNKIPKKRWGGVQVLPYIQNRNFQILRVKEPKTKKNFIFRFVACLIPFAKLRRKIRSL